MKGCENHDLLFRRKFLNEELQILQVIFHVILIKHENFETFLVKKMLTKRQLFEQVNKSGNSLINSSKEYKDGIEGNSAICPIAA